MENRRSRPAVIASRYICRKKSIVQAGAHSVQLAIVRPYPVLPPSGPPAMVPGAVNKWASGPRKIDPALCATRCTSMVGSDASNAAIRAAAIRPPPVELVLENVFEDVLEVGLPEHADGIDAGGEQRVAIVGHHLDRRVLADQPAMG